MKCWRNADHEGPFVAVAFVEEPTRKKFDLCAACRTEWGGEVVDWKP